MTTGKVAIFVDGKNFYEGLRATGSTSRIDFTALARFVVRAAGGRILTGLHYFTGIDAPRVGETDEESDEGRGSLEGFLSFLETQPGCFVQRFPRRTRSVSCNECGHQHTYNEEKEVDTSLVANMIRQAAVNAFDSAVLCSGDADHTPALESLRDLGKPAWVATFGGHGLARRLRQAAYGHIDLCRALDSAVLEPGEYEDDYWEDDGEPYDEEQVDVVNAVREAETYFGDGRYVGLNMFLTDWRSEKLPRDLNERQRLVQQHIDEGELEVYEATDGCKALRVTPVHFTQSEEYTAGQPE